MDPRFKPSFLELRGILQLGEHDLTALPEVLRGEIGDVLRAVGQPSDQGLTLIHFSAQRKRFLWIGGCT